MAAAASPCWFSNITWDSAVIGRELAYSNLLEWIVDTVEYFRARPLHRLIIRVHPAEVKLPGEATRESLQPLIHQRIPELPPTSASSARTTRPTRTN